MGPTAVVPKRTLIPDRLHFVWFGQRLPSFAAIAARSAQAHNPTAQVTLWHEARLEQCQRTRKLRELGIELLPLYFDQLLAEARQRADANSQAALDTLGKVWSSLKAPAARSNVVRLLVLFNYGGVYLDTDTLTLQPLNQLREHPAFCGLEHLLWSRRRLDKSQPYFWTAGPLLTALRLVGCWLPNGYALQRGQLGWYDQAANNAVLGFQPQHPLLTRAFERIGQLPRAEWTKRFRLGTHLLQELLASRPEGELEVHAFSPDYFYPLGPVISTHYFRKRSNARSAAEHLVPKTTHVIHWYASVANLMQLDEAYIRQHPTHSVYTHLCSPYAD